MFGRINNSARKTSLKAPNDSPTVQGHQLVRIAHSSEEMFEHDDCNALNALDLFAPLFRSSEKVEDKTLNINVLNKHSIYQCINNILHSVKNQDSRIKNQESLLSGKTF